MRLAQRLEKQCNKYLFHLLIRGPCEGCGEAGKTLSFTNTSYHTVVLEALGMLRLPECGDESDYPQEQRDLIIKLAIGIVATKGYEIYCGKCRRIVDQRIAGEDFKDVLQYGYQRAYLGTDDVDEIVKNFNKEYLQDFGEEFENKVLTYEEMEIEFANFEERLVRSNDIRRMPSDLDGINALFSRYGIQYRLVCLDSGGYQVVAKQEEPEIVLIPIVGVEKNKKSVREYSLEERILAELEDMEALDDIKEAKKKK